jgi:hypothetical protein
MTKRVVFAVDDSEIPEGIELLDIVLERHFRTSAILRELKGLSVILATVHGPNSWP